MKFKDLTVGMVIEHPPVRVDQDEMLAFARAYDPQWFHVDAERAEDGRWGGLIASGWLTCGLAMRMATESVLEGSESFGSPGLERLRWMAPVRAGDMLRLQVRVDSIRISSSRSDLGIVRWTWCMLNQDDAQVLDLEVTTLFDLADQA
ncbi:MAG: MaoC family dehydratase N-terminal domain-containing protein [Alcaligenaceae bacterium]|nr:MaoC family dehydratase N-terminal domain-containing protein [Alcaligenaceae bacterium]